MRVLFCFFFFCSPYLSTNPFPHILFQRKCGVIRHQLPQFSSLLPPQIHIFTCLKGGQSSTAPILIFPFYASFHTLLHQWSLSSSQYIINSTPLKKKKYNLSLTLLHPWNTTASLLPCVAKLTEGAVCTYSVQGSHSQPRAQQPGVLTALLPTLRSSEASTFQNQWAPQLSFAKCVKMDLSS